MMFNIDVTLYKCHHVRFYHFIVGCAPQGSPLLENGQKTGHLCDSCRSDVLLKNVLQSRYDNLKWLKLQYIKFGTVNQPDKVGQFGHNVRR